MPKTQKFPNYMYSLTKKKEKEKKMRESNVRDIYWSSTWKLHLVSLHIFKAEYHGKSVKSVRPGLDAFSCQLLLNISTTILLWKYGISDCVKLIGRRCTHCVVKANANIPQSLEFYWCNMFVFSSHDHRYGSDKSKWLYPSFSQLICKKHLEFLLKILHNTLTLCR